MGAGGFIGEITLRVASDDVAHVVQRDRPGVPLMFLSDLFVHPLRRGRGWANELMRAVTEHCDAEGQDIWLYAMPFGKHAGPSAIQLMDLYAAWGFRVPEPGEAAGYRHEMVRRCSA